MKKLFIAEKPSVAEAFANAMKCRVQKRDGYMEGDSIVVTWCVGHLVTMSYPDAYDPALKRWSKETLPFLPDKFKYEVIKGVAKQYKIVSGLLKENIYTGLWIRWLRCLIPRIRGVCGSIPRLRKRFYEA